MKKGFTILELTIVMFFISVLGVIVAQGVSKSLRDSRKLEVESQVQRETAIAVERITKVLRSATQLVATSSNSITLRGYPTVNDTVPSEISYYIDGQSLKYSVTPPSGAGPNYIYNPADTTAYTLIKKVSNNSGSPLFVYYNENNVPLTETINKADVRSVEIAPLVLDTTNILTKPFSIKTTVMFRNFKSNL